jgi:hypothetical protein
MLKLNAGLSRKIGEPDYCSRGASVNLELEVESHLVSEPDALLERIRKLFALARQAVDVELNNGRRSAPAGNQRAAASPATTAKPNGRPATAAQLKAIRSICERLDQDAESVVAKRFGFAMAQLSLPEASTLIDELKAKANGAGRSR